MHTSTLLTAKRVAAILGESYSTVIRRIEAGTLPAEKLDGPKGMYLIAREDVDKLIAERATELRAEVERLEEAAAS